MKKRIITLMMAVIATIALTPLTVFAQNTLSGLLFTFDVTPTTLSLGDEATIKVSLSNCDGTMEDMRGVSVTVVWDASVFEFVTGSETKLLFGSPVVDVLLPNGSLPQIQYNYAELTPIAKPVTELFSFKIKAIGFTGPTSNLSATFQASDASAVTTPVLTISNPPTFTINTPTPPTVTSVTPNGTSEPLSGDVEITFSQEMDPAVTGTVTLSGGAYTIGPSSSWNATNTVYTIEYSGLANSILYTVNISGFEDIYNIAMAADNTNQFTTEPPSITFNSAAQTGGTPGTVSSTGIVLTFSADPVGLTAGDITINSGTGAAVKGITLSGSGTTRTIELSSVSIEGDVSVSIGNFGGFTVNGSPQTATVYRDNVAPTVSSITPANGATAVAVSVSVVITFSEAMDDIAGGTVTLSGGSSTMGADSWDITKTIYTIAYSGLDYLQTYTVNISDFKDVAGNTMTANNANSFTTAAPAPTAITFTAVSTTDGVSGVTTSTGIVITFNTSVSGLTAGDITITPGTTLPIGAATKGALTANSASQYTIAISGVTEGNVDVEIADFGSGMASFFFNAGDEKVTDIMVYEDTQAPTLTFVSVNRTLPTAATIAFSTDEAGTAYYLVQDVSVAAPTAAAVLAGTSLGSVVFGTNSGLAVTLTAGPKVIYVVEVDAEGNESNMLTILAKADLSDATVAVSGTLTYDGSPQSPSVTVTLGGTTLTLYTDYTVSNEINAGTHTATITAVGTSDYEGSTTVSFTIDKAQVTIAQGTYDVTKPYDGTVSPGTGTAIATLSITGFVSDGTVLSATPRDYPAADAGTYSVDIDFALDNTANQELVNNTITITTATITQIAYTGLMAASANVPETLTTGNTVLLPALPAGAIYDVPISVGGADPTLIDGTPTVSGTTLTFDANSLLFTDPSSATITIPVTGATNYTNYNVIVTVYVLATMRENTPAASIDFISEMLINLAPGEDYTIDDGSTVIPVTADASGNIPIQAGWFGISLDIIKVGVGSNFDSYAQTLPVPARPAAPGATKTDTSGGLINGEINSVDATMEYKLSSASGWATISGTVVTGLAAGTYEVRYQATTLAFSSDITTLIIASSTPPATTPSAPQNFTAAPGDSEVILSWSAPASDGGSSITSYEVSSDNGVTWVTASSSTGHTFTGLVNGTSYTFRVRAVNAVGAGAEATVTATPNQGLTPNFYNIYINFVTGGTVKASTSTAAAGELVTLTISPAADYELFSLCVFLTDIPSTFITVKGSGTIYTFEMPSGDVTVKAVFVNTSYEGRWEAALKIIEGYSFNILQEEANTIFDLRYILADLINELIYETGFVITRDDIFIMDYNFRPAVAGTLDNRSGTNGYFEFRVSPTGVNSSAFNDGIITATLYDPTANELIDRNVSTWILNNKLHVSGLTQGMPLRLYNLSGILLYQTTATGDKAIIPLPERGLYILITNECRIKIAN